MSLLSTAAFEIHLFQMPSLSTVIFELSKFRRWFRRRLAEVASFKAPPLFSDNANKLLKSPMIHHGRVEETASYRNIAQDSRHLF